MANAAQRTKYFGEPLPPEREFVLLRFGYVVP